MRKIHGRAMMLESRLNMNHTGHTALFSDVDNEMISFQKTGEHYGGKYG